MEVELEACALIKVEPVKNKAFHLNFKSKKILRSRHYGALTLIKHDTFLMSGRLIVKIMGKRRLSKHKTINKTIFLFVVIVWPELYSTNYPLIIALFSYYIGCLHYLCIKLIQNCHQFLITYYTGYGFDITSSWLEAICYVKQRRIFGARTITDLHSFLWATRHAARWPRLSFARMQNTVISI